MPKTRHYQAGRTHLRRSITLSPQALEDHEAIAAARPDLIYLSAACAEGLRALRREISEKKEKD